jgi:hypothetical protein
MRRTRVKEESLLRAIGYAEYNPQTPVEERKGAPQCVVSHPDSGGVCAEAAVMEVWSLPFCRRHGDEAKLAALDEITMSLDGIFRGLADAEQQRYDRNEAAAKMLEENTPTLDFDAGELEKAMVAAYPPEELEDGTDADTLRFDYIERGIMDGPYDWWCDAQLLSCRFMRQAYDRGLSGLLQDLEYARERATVQRVLAKRNLDRRWTHVRHARKEAAKGTPA